MKVKNKELVEGNQNYITRKLADFETPSGEFFLGTFAAISREYSSLLYHYASQGNFSEAVTSLKNLIEFAEKNYALFTYWKKYIFNDVINRHRSNIIQKLFSTREKKVSSELKTFLNNLGVNAHIESVNKFLKEEINYFIRISKSDKEKYLQDRTEIMTTELKIHRSSGYIFSKIILGIEGKQMTQLLKFFYDQEVIPQYPSTYYYKIFLSYILHEDPTELITYFTEQKTTYYFYVKHMVLAMKYLLLDDRAMFIKSLEASLEDYKKDCRSMVNGFRAQPEEDLSIDALAIAILGAKKGWEIDIEHEKFPTELFKYILEKSPV